MLLSVVRTPLAGAILQRLIVVGTSCHPIHANYQNRIDEYFFGERRVRSTTAPEELLLQAR